MKKVDEIKYLTNKRSYVCVMYELIVLGEYSTVGTVAGHSCLSSCPSLYIV